MQQGQLSQKEPFEYTAAQKQQIATNTATDVGGAFEIGNSVIGFAASPISGFISLGVATACYTARSLGEIKRVNPDFNVSNVISPDTTSYKMTKPVLKLANYMSENIGASMIISGTALGVSALFALPETVDMTSTAGFYQSSKEACILGSFSLANTVRGVARNLHDDSIIKRKVFDSAGAIAASAGSIMTVNNPDNPIGTITLKAIFATAGLAAVYETIKGKAPELLQPDKVFASAFLLNATMSNSPTMIMANMLFAGAFLSLDSLKQDGGVYQRLQRAFPSLTKS